MAASGQVTVTNAATALDLNTTAAGRDILVRNRGSVAVFVGGPGVTTGNGFQLDPGDSIAADTADGTGTGSGLYGIVASGTAVVHVLQVG